MKKCEQISIESDDGEKYVYDVLDYIEKDDIEYIVAKPEDSDDDEDVCIFEVINAYNEEKEYLDITDTLTGEKIFDEYEEKIEKEIEK